jgi:hypothetical protein
VTLPREIERYRSRMTPEKVWPAGHAAAEVAEKIDSVVDRTADVLRWSTNDRCMHDDLLAAWLVLGVITEAQATATHEARRVDDAAFIARYRESGADVMSGEELAEARAEHGPGTVLVNVLTGRRTVL